LALVARPELAAIRTGLLAEIRLSVLSLLRMGAAVVVELPLQVSILAAAVAGSFPRVLLEQRVVVLHPEGHTSL
jgi:hypothetical protein